MKGKIFYIIVYFFSVSVFSQSLKIPTVYVDNKLRTNRSHRKSSFPYVTGDTFRTYADHVVDEAVDFFDPSTVREGEVVFVYTYLLDFFFDKVHPCILFPYILLTHNAIPTMPGKYISYLNDKKVIAWFAKNGDPRMHKKMFTLPLGLANNYYAYGKINLIEEVRKLNFKKKYFLYLNFIDRHNKQERIHVRKLFHVKSFCYSSERKPFYDYLVDMASSKFVLSPEGTGVDCYRTWEALILGSIPIVKSSFLDPIFYDLPVLIVKDWEEITEEFLLSKYEKLSSRKFNFDKLYAKYWFGCIDECRQKHLMKLRTEK